ncbi:hypothetical protein [uncultured Formosa sp.]|uniref:hypothetical protein n=1 Tax=uncultured Formosa sp. TaxID=255435 RepID=UPI0026094FE6|nr:hypothetical protein [uncultured Formosa sp.]
MQYHPKKILKNTLLLFLSVGGVFFTLCGAKSESQNTVLTVPAFKTAITYVLFSNVITLVKSVCNNAQLILESPEIVANKFMLSIENKGYVILENYSNFRIEGEFIIHIENRIFNNVGMICA